MERNEKEQYAQDVESYEGTVPLWLVIVYLGMLAWGIYYLVRYWGGLGPGF